uniref:Uncharacterized protein n=1 Tax=Oryza brachyantha TaxID=4533 RepID=J3NAG1_ORYBR
MVTLPFHVITEHVVCGALCTSSSMNSFGLQCAVLDVVEPVLVGELTAPTLVPLQHAKVHRFCQPPAPHQDASWWRRHNTANPMDGTCATAARRVAAGGLVSIAIPGLLAIHSAALSDAG